MTLDCCDTRVESIRISSITCTSFLTFAAYAVCSIGIYLFVCVSFVRVYAIHTADRRWRLPPHYKANHMPESRSMCDTDEEEGVFVRNCPLGGEWEWIYLSHC